MTTISINTRTKTGKAIFEMLNAIATNEKSIIIHPSSKKNNKEKEESYNPKFVEKVLNARNNERHVRIKTSDLWENI